MPQTDDYSNFESSATRIQAGQLVNGEFETNTDVDQFKIHLDAGWTFQVFTTLTDASINWASVSVAWPESERSGISYPVTKGGSPPSLTFTTTVEGDYYIKMATMPGSGTGKYTVSVVGTKDDYSAAPSKAGSVGADGIIRGTFETQNDRDWFGLSLEAGYSYWFIRGTGSNIAYAPKLAMMDASGARLAAGDTGAMSFTPTQTGKYYLELAGDWSQNYAVKMIKGPADEAGDNATTAHMLQQNSVVSGALQNPYDNDMYAFDAKAGGIYLVELFRQSDNQGVLSVSTGDGPTFQTATQIAQEGDQPGTMVITPAQAGKQYLTINNIVPDASFAFLGGYRIKVSEQTDDFSANATTSGQLLGTTPLLGTLNYPGDKDWVRVHMEAGNRYAFSLQGAPSGAGTLDVGRYSTGLTLYDGASVEQSGALQPVSEQLTNGVYTVNCKTTGDYFVAVSSSSGKTGTYTLTTNLVTGDTIATKVTAFTPDNGRTAVDLNGRITLKFDEAIVWGSGQVKLTATTEYYSSTVTYTKGS